MSSGLGWLVVLALVANSCGIYALDATGEREGAVVPEETEEAQDRAVGVNYRPPFDPAYSSHGISLSLSKYIDFSFNIGSNSICVNLLCFQFTTAFPSAMILLNIISSLNITATNS